MTFATPVLLFLVPLAALLLVARHRHPPATPTLAVSSIEALLAARGSHVGWRVRLVWLPGTLQALAIAILLVALARPQRGTAVTTIPQEGIDIALALDVSGSMRERTTVAAGRSGPTKLEAAREVIGGFIGGLPAARFGLVIFQSQSLVLSPLTTDQAALRRTVSSVDSGLLPDGTAIGLGLAEALNLLRNSPARSRVVVLLTDGQNNAGVLQPLDAARVAKALGIRVYTVGFVSGRPDDVDAVMLRRMAEDTGGTYQDASTQAQLARAYAAIGALERSRVSQRTFTSYEEFGPQLAAIALALLVLAAVLRGTVLRRYP